MTKRKHTISILVENKPGVLQRISGLFTRRNFNIDNITVGKTEEPTISRITIRTTGDNQTLEQITKQLNKLIEVLKVRELKPENTIKRELALIKVHAPDEKNKIRNNTIYKHIQRTYRGCNTKNIDSGNNRRTNKDRFIYKTIKTIWNKKKLQKQVLQH